MKRILLALPAFIIFQSAQPALADTLTLESPAFARGTLDAAQVYNSFGCTGGNISPAVSWTGLPEGTKSLALTLYDPDAPTGSGWWHWVVFNIPADVSAIPEAASTTDSMPQGAVESRTDYGTPGFGGACPPEGDKPHRYILTLHALGIDSIPLDANAPAAMVGYYIQANTLEKSNVTATYSR